MEFNFISENVDLSDCELFFQTNKLKDFILMESHWKMCHIMFMSGIFPSVSQARKNGWNKDIPNGFNMFTVGKKKTQIYVLNKI